MNQTAKMLTVTLTDQNDNAPVITTSAALSVEKNTLVVAALTSTDLDTVGTNPAAFSVSSGRDAALFDVADGNLVFKTDTGLALVEPGRTGGGHVRVVLGSRCRSGSTSG